MKIDFSYTARRQLLKLPHDLRLRIGEKMEFYSKQTNPLSFAKHTSGKSYRFRVGNYRVRFELINNEIQIFKIERRDKAYD